MPTLFEMKDVCLDCSLPICDDKDAQCAFVQITREVNRAAYRNFYAQNREKEIARVTKWQQENRERRNKYFRERYAAKKTQAEKTNGVFQ